MVGYGAGGSRSPHGERGLKFSQLRKEGLLPGRSPHGERGLKYGGQQR